MTGARTLTGSWDGIFNYPRDLPPTAFTARIEDHDGAIAGETAEPGQAGATSGQTLHGFIQGSRSGNGISFTKIYDDHHPSPIAYVGTINDDATEITGRWTIPGQWSGTFIMVRRPAKEAPAETRAAQTVER